MSWGDGRSSGRGMTQGREESEKKEDVGELGELFWCLWVFQSGHPVEKQWIMGKMEGKGRKKGEKHGALRGWKSGSLKKWRSDSLERWKREKGKVKVEGLE